MKTYAILFFSIGLIFLSCQKIEYDNPLIGTWEAKEQGEIFTFITNTHTLVIRSEGNSTYLNSAFPKSGKSGRARIKNGFLKIGRKDFRINAYPSLIFDSSGDYYQMTLNNLDYKKQ